MIEIASDGYPRILPAYDDGVFKSLHTRPGSEIALTDSISGFIDRTITGVMVRGSELPIKDINVKREIFDINCIATDNELQFGIEMQAAPMENDSAKNGHAQIRHRSIYYLTDLHASQPGRGLDYQDFTKSYQITVCNYRVMSEPHKLVEKFMMRNEQGILLADAITSILVDLTLTKEIVKKPIAEMTAGEMWAVFYAKANDPEYYNLIKDIAKKREGIKVAQEVLYTISQDEHERARYRSRRIWEQDRECERVLRERWEQDMALREQDIAFKEQYIEIKEQDIEIKGQEIEIKGQEIALREQEMVRREQEIALREQEMVRREQGEIMSIAKNLLTTSMSIDEIITATGLTREEVEK